VLRQPLTKQQVINAIERKGDSSIPLMLHKWWGEGLAEKHGMDVLEQISHDIPEDINMLWYNEPGYELSSNGNPNMRLAAMAFLHPTTLGIKPVQ